MKYWPLICLILIALLAAVAITSHVGGDMIILMHYFMGCFLCQFAMLKLFHPSQFQEGFAKYDLLAMRIKAYGYLYPWIELGLGLAYLSFISPSATYLATIIVMGIGTLGVVNSLRKGLNVKCACMGTVLDVPLSTVTLTEDIGMGLMALFMLLGG